MLRGCTLAVVVVVASVAGVGIASANESPLAAAGLDQDVQVGAMVYLDAGGSIDPDGSIERYRWTITAPNGTTMTPDCPSCEQTSFLAGQNGTYEVTVTVTDGDGATQSDTLYVTARGGEPPSVSVTGPTAVENGTSVSLTASALAGDADLSALVWTINGTEVGRQAVDGTETERTFGYTVSESGWRNFQVRVVDEAGNAETATHAVRSVRKSPSPNSEPAPVASGPSGDSGGPNIYHEVLERQTDSGNYYIYLTNGVIDGRGPGALFNEKQVGLLDQITGIDITTRQTNTGPSRALEITNPLMKEDIDKEAGKLGAGFNDSTNEYISTDPRSYQTGPVWDKEDPGDGWEKTGKRVVGTTTVDTRQSKSNYELVDRVRHYKGQYQAKSPRDSNDRNIGTNEITKTYWQSSIPSDGRVVDTRQDAYYTWTETTEVKTGTKTVTKTRTKQVCIEKTTLYGTEYCWEYQSVPYTYTEEVTTYKTKTTQMRASNPPHHTTAQIHTTTEYKVEEVVETVNIYQSIDVDYKYDIYEYKWERTDI